MKLKLIAVYLDNSQLEYIIAVFNTLTQENYNFEFEYFDAQNEIARRFGIKSFPSFLLLKNDHMVSVIEGKLDIRELESRLLNSTYVSKTTV